MNKIKELQRVNNIISQKLKYLDSSIKRGTKYKSELLFTTSNDETSIEIYSIKGDEKSKTFIENEFQRIICIKGEIKINLYNDFDEEITLSSANTILIPPQTTFTIECIKDAEIIVVYKPKKENNEAVLIIKSIYEKKD